MIVVETTTTMLKRAIHRIRIKRDICILRGWTQLTKLGGDICLVQRRRHWTDLTWSTSTSLDRPDLIFLRLHSMNWFECSVILMLRAAAYCNTPSSVSCYRPGSLFHAICIAYGLILSIIQLNSDLLNTIYQMRAAALGNHSYLRCNRSHSVTTTSLDKWYM